MKDLRASIDIGSNSILLLMGEFSPEYKELENHANVTALGANLDKTGVFDTGSMEDSFRVLKEYADKIKSHGMDPAKVLATATEASRVAGNAEEFYTKVKEQTGIEVKIISSEGEAYYSTKGILFNSKFDESTIHIMDIGGASTEIIKVDAENSQILLDYSMPFGAVRMTNWKDENTLHDNVGKILNDYQDKLKGTQCTKLYCVAGTMTSVANMYLGNKEFKEKEVHGLNISVDVLNKLSREYSDQSVEELLSYFPFLGKRAKSIHGGLSVATTLFKTLGVTNVSISTYGLRYGTLEEGVIKDEFIIR